VRQEDKDALTPSSATICLILDSKEATGTPALKYRMPPIDPQLEFDYFVRAFGRCPSGDLLRNGSNKLLIFNHLNTELR
jgi:hypothetical protein